MERLLNTTSTCYLTVNIIAETEAEFRSEIRNPKSGDTMKSGDTILVLTKWERLNKLRAEFGDMGSGDTIPNYEGTPIKCRGREQKGTFCFSREVEWVFCPIQPG